jgi:hypothetical protein
VHNEAGYADAYKDVVHEDAIKVGGTTKAPDYCFRVGGTRKFFLEAKKPSVDIHGEPGPAYQLRRYAWSAKLPLSILTDFAEFAVYDGRIPPCLGDPASVARIMYLTCDQYADHWDDIASIFSKEALLQGSFDKYVLSHKKRGTAEVDSEFLREIELWREALARNIAARNEQLTVRQLNHAVQSTIDRIVFLRICEDRGVETYGTLQGLLAGDHVYARLVELFRAADDRYNSGLFHFRQESERPTPVDELTPDLTIDDKVLKDLLRSLYYPASRYEFSVISADILGNVYEGFLGKVIRLTPGRRVVVEEKPEVKKAGGVFYTPKHIVDYIVQHTVGRLLLATPPHAAEANEASPLPVAPPPLTAETLQAWKTPRQLARLRICDPACGSGSFLLAAYKRLLDYHRDWYLADGPEKHRKQLYQGAGGHWYLATEEKKRILLGSIFGVDIDPQAVEVTKLNLLLCVLENENQSTVRQLALIHQRALPDLGANIRCGNSLIGTDFYNGRQLDLFDEEAQYRINAFDWETEFPDVFKGTKPGFEVVIGNPPYVLLQDQFKDEEQLTYLRRGFVCASYKVDTYHLFMEKALRLGTYGCRCSFITPANFLTNNHLVRLRRLLLEESNIDHIAVIDEGVFPGVSVDNAILVTVVGNGTASWIPVIHAVSLGTRLVVTSHAILETQSILKDEHLLFSGPSGKASRLLWGRVKKQAVPLGDLAHVNFGKQLRDRKVFLQDVIRVPSAKEVPDDYRACYTGRDVFRYRVAWGGLACRNEESARCGGCWDQEKQDARDKIITRQVGRFPEFGLDPLGYQCLNTVFMINLREPTVDVAYLLGLLNSRFVQAFWIEHFYDQRRTFPKIKGTYLKQLPILVPSVHRPDLQDHEGRIAALAREMIRLADRASKPQSPSSEAVLRRQIGARSREIDRLVYELFRLTEKEIRTVENIIGGTGGKVAGDDSHE